MIEIVVWGDPGPQGSKDFKGISKRTGRAILAESSLKVKPWREAVVYAAVEVLERRGNVGIPGAVEYDMIFTLPKPKSAKRGAVPSKKPDGSKLIRSTEDALTTAGVWEDDARVVCGSFVKRYVNEGPDALPRPGAVIRVRALSEVQNLDKIIEGLL